MNKMFLTCLFTCNILYASTLPLVNYDPFSKSQKILHTHKQYKPRTNFFVLSAIFNNRAFINNRFYTRGENIQGYKIKKISSQSVVLQYKNRIKIIHLQQHTHHIQTQKTKREKR